MLSLFFIFSFVDMTRETLFLSSSLLLIVCDFYHIIVQQEISTNVEDVKCPEAAVVYSLRSCDTVWVMFYMFIIWCANWGFLAFF